MTILEGKHALVTGGGSGIGAAITFALAQAGAQVTICGRRAEELEFTAERHPDIHTQAADVTDVTSIGKLYRTAQKARGPFAIVVANAGTAESAPAEKLTPELWTRTLDTNLTGAFFSVQPALAGMREKKWGRIVFIASTAGLKGYPYVAPYVAAKHGVVGLARALAAETAKDGVTVNAICPGFTETSLLDRAVDRIAETDQNQRDRSAQSPAVAQSTRPLHPAAGSRRCGGVAVPGRQRRDHRTNHFGIRRRDVVSAPLSALRPQPDSKARLRLWIRLLRVSRLIEGVTRERLKKQFGATLPRFDVMAALCRKPDGMLMSEISRFLMVSNGNVTGIVDRLVADGFVARAQRNGDRRTSFVSLTRKGRAAFAQMAAAHENWIDELLGSVSARDAEQLSTKLKSFRSDWESGA